ITIAEFLELRLGVFERLWRIRKNFFVVNLVANHCMRADQHTLTALDTNIFIPDRDLQRKIALFPLRGGGGEGAIYREGRDGQVIAVGIDDLTKHILDELRRFIRDWESACHRRGDLRRNLD